MRGGHREKGGSDRARGGGEVGWNMQGAAAPKGDNVLVEGRAANHSAG